MENSVFLGVRMPDVPYYRECFQDIPLDCNLAQSGLVEKAVDRFNLESNEIALVFCGRPLNDDSNLREQGVRPGVTIHVMKKPRTKPQTTDNPPLELPLSEEKLKQVTAAYKRLWTVTGPRVIARIVKEFPEIREDLGALAILMDPILLSSMKSAENLQEIAKRYPVFIHVAPAIENILWKSCLLPEKVRLTTEYEDSESSSSSSSEDLTFNNPGGLNNNNNNNNNGTSSRQITQAQLAEALAFVGAAFRSSQTATAAAGETSREPMDQAAAADPSESEVGNTTTTGRSTDRRSENAINESMLNSALNNIQSTEGASGSSTTTTADLMTRYSQELLHMREMGLTDDQVNLQALQICNGDLESAINLVFSSS